MATVYGVSASPFVRKLRVFLDEKGIDYETKPVFPGTDDESFRAISPLGKIPAYLEGILGRDSFKALIAEDSQLLGG